jgi:hypothetical protein
VKIFEFHEILADFNICICKKICEPISFPESFRKNMCKTVAMREAA